MPSLRGVPGWRGPCFALLLPLCLWLGGAAKGAGDSCMCLSQSCVQVLIFLLRRQCVTRGSGEMGWEELASWVPADCAALNSPSQLLCRLSGVACKPTCFSEGGNLVGAVPWQQETASFRPALPRG